MSRHLPPLRLFGVFETVCRTNSLRAAAAALNVSQPAVSQSLRQLEDHIGARLIDRNTRPASLTAEGEILLRATEDGLGRIYGGRDGAEPDPEKALIWLNKAVEAGDTGSMCDLGLHFFNGWGVKTNQKHAAELYRDAAKLGDLWGAYLLGLCYREGAGVKKNRHWALHWLDKAADEHPEARDMAYLIRYGDE